MVDVLYVLKKVRKYSDDVLRSDDEMGSEKSQFDEGEVERK